MAAVLAGACAGSGPVAETASHVQPFRGTSAVIDVRRPDAPPVMVESVRAAGHEGYDRVVFEFSGSIPGYKIEYVDGPVRDCGSGQPQEVPGDALLMVRLAPAAMHDEQGTPTVRDRARSPNLNVVKHMQAVCDFEGHVEWVLGLHGPNPYRITEIGQPPRLVVDVGHEAPARSPSRSPSP